jgi:hypothetical protein
MVKYRCHNCHDQEFRNIASIIDHIWVKHSLIVERKLKSVWIAEDSRQSLRKKKKKRVSSYRCTDCNVLLGKTLSLLRHLDEKHGIHIWYERGLTKKRVFFDGILEDTVTEERRKKKEWIPLSKRPFEPRRRKADED